MEGWIKIHRKLLERGRYNDGPTKDLFIHILLICSHKEVNYKGQILMPGQCTVGRKYLAQALGLTEMQVRRAINNLLDTGEITIKTTNRFSLITLVKWEDYQTLELKTTNKTTNKQPAKQPTNNQQTTTIQECKEEKKKETEIPDYLLNNFNAFVEYRKASKNPMSELAKKLLLTNVQKLGKTPAQQNKILENSIMNGRKGVFALKEEDCADDPVIFKRLYDEGKVDILKRALGTEKYFAMKKALPTN